MQQHVSTAVRGCLNKIACGLHFQARNLGQGSGDLVAVTSRSIHAGADCGCAQVDLQQAALSIAQQCLFLVQVIRKALEFIAQGHRHSVLELGTAHLQDVLELIALVLERGAQAIHAVNEVVNRCMQTQAETGRVSIVGGLGHVHIIIRVDDVIRALLLTKVFQSKVGNNLVGIHIQRGTSATLENVQRELVHAAALFQDLVTSPDDGFGLLLRQHVKATVCHGSRLLDLHHAANEVRDGVDGHIRNLEVLHGANGVHTVVSVRWNFQRAKKVGLGTSLLAGVLRCLLFGHLLLCSVSGSVSFLLLHVLCCRLGVLFFFLRGLCHDGSAPLPVETYIRMSNLKR